MFSSVKSSVFHRIKARIIDHPLIYEHNFPSLIRNRIHNKQIFLAYRKSRYSFRIYGIQLFLLFLSSFFNLLQSVFCLRTNLRGDKRRRER